MKIDVGFATAIMIVAGLGKEYPQVRTLPKTMVLDQLSRNHHSWGFLTMYQPSALLWTEPLIVWTQNATKMESC